MKKFKVAASIFVNPVRKRGFSSGVNGNFAQLKEKLKIAKLEGADVVELRVDSEPEISEDDLVKLKAISKELKIPAIFTLRSKEEGGKYNFSSAKKLKLLKKAIDLNFEYVDIELKFLEKLGKTVLDLKENSETKIILSCHNLKGAESLNEMRKIKNKMLNSEADILKIAVFSKNERTNRDILKLIKETKKEGKNIIGIAMGEKGKEARLKAIQGNYFSYFSLNEKEKTAPGQISLTEFKKWKIKFKS